MRIGNQAFYNDFKLSREHAIDQAINSLDSSPWNLPAVREFLLEAAKGKKEESALPVEYQDSNNQKRSVVLTSNTVDQSNSGGKLILFSIRRA